MSTDVTQVNAYADLGAAWGFATRLPAFIRSIGSSDGTSVLMSTPSWLEQPVRRERLVGPEC